MPSFPSLLVVENVKSAYNEYPTIVAVPDHEPCTLHINSVTHLNGILRIEVL